MTDSLWEFIEAKHEAFPRERYEEIVEIADEEKAQGNMFNKSMHDMAQLKLRFHDYLEENPRSYAQVFASLYRRALFEYITSRVRVSDGDVAVQSVEDAITAVLDQVQGSDLEDLQEPFKGITDVITTDTDTGYSDKERWDALQQTLEELEELQRFDMIRTVWNGSRHARS